MWKLTITRRYKKIFKDGDSINLEAEFEYQSEYLEELTTIIRETNELGVGEYAYTIERIEEGEQE